MRLLLAALFAYVATATSITFVPEGMISWALIVIMPLSVFVAFVLFDKGFLRRLVTSDARIVQQELEKGRAEKTTHEVNRALSFEDRRTGRMAHFLELRDGSVMVLHGQYLYEYEPIDDDPEVNQPRRFPTAEFTVVRSLKNNELLDLNVGSTVIGTRFIQEPDDYRVIADLGFRFEDGEIVEGASFDELEAALTARGA